MLTSLLPGLRHFRTPFAVGALCAFQLWIILGEAFPSRSEANGLLHRVYSLGEMTGRPIVTGVIAFVLYLFGDIVKVRPELITKILSRLHIDILSRAANAQLNVFARGAFRKRGILQNIKPAHELAWRMRTEFPDVRLRLIADHADIYLEQDRIDSEADFRMNMALFSATLWIVLAVYYSPWVLFGFIASIVLFRNGVRATRDANTILVQVVASEIIGSRFYVEAKNVDDEEDSSHSI